MLRGFVAVLTVTSRHNLMIKESSKKGYSLEPPKSHNPDERKQGRFVRCRSHSTSLFG